MRLFQNESSCQTFLTKMRFHINRFAVRLVLTQRQKATVLDTLGLSNKVYMVDQPSHPFILS